MPTFNTNNFQEVCKQYFAYRYFSKRIKNFYSVLKSQGSQNGKGEIWKKLATKEVHLALSNVVSRYDAKK